MSLLTNPVATTPLYDPHAAELMSIIFGIFMKGFPKIVRNKKG